MRKKLLYLIILVLIILLLIIYYIKLFNDDYKYYENKQLGIKVRIPSLSLVIKASKNEVKVISLNSKMHAKHIYDNFQDINCYQDIYKYDKKNNILFMGIDNIMIFPITIFTFKINKGKLSSEECNKIVDYKKIRYWVTNKDKAKNATLKFSYQYKDEDGKLYNVYTNPYQRLVIKTGTNRYEEIPNLLYSRWMSMNDFINFLEYQVKRKHITKTIYKDGGSILYKAEDFSLLKCNTISGNKDIYISDTSLKYKKAYCRL